MSNTIILMGGGIDSSFIAYEFSKKNKKQIVGLHFDYGQLSAKFEKEAVLKIGDFLGFETVTKIDNAISLQQQQIEKLQEYKATLINSAVTGKFKVPMPENLDNKIAHA